MITLIIIYIASIIGAILSIRYDDDFFDEKPWTLFLVFCPVVIHLNLDKKFYKLIRLGRK